MAMHNNNIAEFNAEINEIMQKLQSRGVGVLDLLGQLFHVYTACCTNETPFYRYIEGLENQYIDGDITRTTKMLMEKSGDQIRRAEGQKQVRDWQQQKPSSKRNVNCTGSATTSASLA
jgi:hypothetical protein